MTSSAALGLSCRGSSRQKNKKGEGELVCLCCERHRASSSFLILLVASSKWTVAQEIPPASHADTGHARSVMGHSRVCWSTGAWQPDPGGKSVWCLGDEDARFSLGWKCLESLPNKELVSMPCAEWKALGAGLLVSVSHTHPAWRSKWSFLNSGFPEDIWGRWACRKVYLVGNMLIHV